MNAMPIGNMGRLLYEERFISMFADFSHWRVDSFWRQMEAEKRKGRVLPFVRGLRLSSQLVYTVRELLSGTGLTANWGHLLDSDENLCSCECDVIIHKEGHIRQWNGGIMDFRFIKQEQAIAVISCKSFLRKSDIDKEYCRDMINYVDKVWLFAECCGPKSVKGISKKAKELGYEKFWHLYTWSKQTDPEPNRTGWIDFVKEVEKLKPSATKKNRTRKKNQ
jgi:hypothetical protein